jgi:hypothetical protein
MQRPSAKPSWRPGGRTKDPPNLLLSAGAALSLSGRGVATPGPVTPTPRAVAVTPRAAPTPAKAAPAPTPTPTPAPAEPAPPPTPPPAPRPATPPPAAEPAPAPAPEPAPAPAPEPAPAEPAPALAAPAEPVPAPEPEPAAAAAPPSPEPVRDGFITIVWADLTARLPVEGGHVSVCDIDAELALRAVFPRCDIELTRVPPRGIDMRTAAWDALEAKDSYDVFFDLRADVTYYALVREHEAEAAADEARKEEIRAGSDAALAARAASGLLAEARDGCEMDSGSAAAAAAVAASAAAAVAAVEGDAAAVGGDAAASIAATADA